MTITVTRLATEHSGSASAGTDTFEGEAYVAGRQYLVIWHLLQNGAGAWNPEDAVAVSDDAGGSWSLIGSSTGTTAYTGGGTNGTTLIAHLTSPVPSTDGDVDILTDFNDLAATQYIRGGAIYELSSDVGEITIAQVVGQVNSTGSMSLDWSTTPSGLVIACWGIIHNSVATFDAEPTDLTADFTNAASVCAFEIQTGSPTADPLAYSMSVTGTDFDYHALAFELAEPSTGDDLTDQVDDAVGVTDSTAVAVSRARSASDAVGVTDTASAAVSRSRGATDAVGVTDAVTAAVSRPRTAADAVGVTDAVQVAIARRITVADAVGVTDVADVQAAGDVTRTRADAVGVTDSVSVAVGRARTAADDVGVTDAAEVVVGHRRLPADAVGVADLVSVAITKRITVADAVGVTDAAAADGGTEVVRPDIGHRVLGFERRHKIVAVEQRHTIREVR